MVLKNGQGHYLRAVLRLKSQSKVALFNGIEGEWLSTIKTITKKYVELEVIKKIIADLQKKGVSVLITDHSAQNVLSIVDRCSIISGGEIITSGKPKEIIQNSKARQLYFGENFNI